MNINGNTKLACLIGHPVSHSFSPYIHNYLAEKYALNMKYMCFDIKKEQEVGHALQGIKALGIMGSNVTIPYKIKVMDYLDEIDEHAKIIGAVNTIKNEEGKLIGYNTDGIGFIKSVLDAGHTLKGKRVVVLGAGGASRAIVVELAAQGVKSINIRNNTLEKATRLMQDVQEHFKEVQIEVGKLEITEEELKQVDVLINTTPLGMSTKKDLCPIDEKITPPQGLVVCDIVYNPHETKLLLWAKKHQLPTVYGIGMLINQAVYSFTYWTGKEIVAFEELLEVLRSQGVIER